MVDTILGPAPRADHLAQATPGFAEVQSEIDLVCDSFGARPAVLPLLRNLLDFDIGVPAALLMPRPVASDFLRTEEGYEITMELPGLDETDVEVQIAPGLLTIHADRQDARMAAASDCYLLSERRFGQAMRSFRLPAAADAERLSLSCRRGVLQIRIPRSAEA